MILSLLLFASLACNARQHNDTAHVIIIAGQSNTDGRVPVAQLPAYIKRYANRNATPQYSEGAYPYCLIARNDISGRFKPYWPCAVRDRGTNALWGYDAVAMFLIGEKLQQPFYVIKWAVGGTSIQHGNNPDKGRYWSADPQWLAVNKPTAKGGHSLLLSLMAEADSCIDNTLAGLNRGYRIDAFVWHQGESDCKFGSRYYDNLSAVVKYVRTRLTLKTGKNYMNLPFVFGTVARSNKQYSAEVEEAQRRFASEDGNAYLIDMGDATLLKDRLHFDAGSAEKMGRKVARIVLKLISRK